MENENKWEDVAEGNSDCLQRYKVEGGYLYHNTVCDGADHRYFNIAMCFVPDIDLQRYQAHLRDAYTKGYADGQEDAKNGVVNSEEGLIGL